MTESEHADLSMQVAYAIGWPNVGRVSDKAVVWEDGLPSKPFDYRAPDVAFALLKWLGDKGMHAYPWSSGKAASGWHINRYKPSEVVEYAPTLELAIARAVLASVSMGLPATHYEGLE